MAIYSRIRQARINYLCHQFRRCYYQITAPSLADSAPSNKLSTGLFQHPNCVVHRRPADIFDNARLFAAPVQVKKKVEEKDPTGPRLNDQIKAQSVRLVTDDGHSVVPLHIALRRAQELGQDLVEVQRDPCVVRIMDYHKERYVKQLKEKDKAKAKSKSTGTLRTGDNKEVRVSPKCEQKDLQMKADAAKRLMERGYRVKCMVMGTEDQDLGGMLSRFTKLIEDVATVESGPRVERKQAYVLVRHEKFGPLKRGGKKAITVAKTGSSGLKESDLEGSEVSEAESDDCGEASPSQEQNSPLPAKHNKERWSLGDSGNSCENMFDYPGDSKGVAHRGPMDHQLKGMRQPANPSSSPQLRSDMENRYSRQGGPQVGPHHGQGQAQWTNNRVNPDASGARPGGEGWAQGTDGPTGPRWAPRINTRGDPSLNQGINNQADQNTREPRMNQGMNNQAGQDARGPRFNQGINNQAEQNTKDPRLNQGMNNQAGQDARGPRFNQGMNNQPGQYARDARPAFNRFPKPEDSGGASNQSTSYGMFSASNRNIAVEPNNRPGSSESQDVRDPKPAFKRISEPEGRGGASNQNSYGMFSASNRNAGVGNPGLPQNTGSGTAPSCQSSPMSRTEGGNHDAGR